MEYSPQDQGYAWMKQYSGYEFNGSGLPELVEQAPPEDPVAVQEERYDEIRQLSGENPELATQQLIQAIDERSNYYAA